MVHFPPNMLMRHMIVQENLEQISSEHTNFEQDFTAYSKEL